jgi:hypothetical protein
MCETYFGCALLCSLSDLEKTLEAVRKERAALAALSEVERKAALQKLYEQCALHMHTFVVGAPCSPPFLLRLASEHQLIAPFCGVPV